DRGRRAGEARPGASPGMDPPDGAKAPLLIPTPFFSACADREIRAPDRRAAGPDRKWPRDRIAGSRIRPVSRERGGAGRAISAGRPLFGIFAGGFCFDSRQGLLWCSRGPSAPPRISL
ncbi:MAG: hypothetical protein WC262_09785, partial [Bacteroidales bacterium]